MFSNTLSLSQLATALQRFAGLAAVRPRSLSRWIPRRPVLGIQVHGHSLFLSCFQFRVGRPPSLLCGSIHEFDRLKPVELGKQLADFLLPLHGEEPTIVLGLPRKDVVVRFFELPASARRSFSEAAALQVDMYKPNDAEIFDWDATVLEESGRLSVALLFAAHSLVEKFVALFSEAGYPLSQITATQFAFLRRLFPPHAVVDSTRHILLDSRGSEAELALLDGHRLVYSRAFTFDGQEPNTAQVMGQIRLAFSALRWKDDDRYSVHLVRSVPTSVSGALSAFGQPEILSDSARFQPLAGDFDAPSFLASAALALASRPRPRLYSLNLLPAAMRPLRGHLRHLPAYILLALNILALVGLALRVPIQNYVLLRQYRKEIAAVHLRADEIKQLLQSGRAMRQEILDLDAFRRHGRLPLDALNDVAQKLPPDAWISAFSCKKDQLEFSGSAKAASPLLSLFQSSPQFRDVKFVGALSQDSSGSERFRLQMQLKEKP